MHVMNEPFVIVEEEKSPIMFYKPNYNFIELMEENGYNYLEEERMGASMVFEKDGKKYYGHGRMGGGILPFWTVDNIIT